MDMDIDMLKLVETHQTASEFIQKLRTFGSIVTKARASDRFKFVETKRATTIMKSDGLIKVSPKNSLM